MYLVQRGDSLSRIAQRQYGDSGQWRRIYDANRGTLRSPNLIYPGQRLTIPGRDGGAAEPESATRPV